MIRIRMALLFAFGMVEGYASAQMLKLQPTVNVSGSRVLLRDIVYASEALPEGWGEREVAEAPAPKKKLTLTLSEIATVLRSHEDMRNVVLRGPTSLQVTSLSQSLEADRIDEALNVYQERHTAEQNRRFRVQRDRVTLPPLPNGVMTVAVLALRENIDLGRMVAELDVRIDGEPVSGARGLTVPLIELRPYWATARPLLRSAILSDDDVVVRWFESGTSARYCPASDSVTGMELRRSVPEERILTADMLAPPIYVRRGEMVRVVSEQKGITVTLRARALADGRRNEQIGCINERSGRKLYVRLVGPREALLQQPGESAL